MNLHEQEEFDWQPSSIAEWDRFDTELGAYNRGDTESEWILSDRDVWYRNPHYTGKPSGSHPEDYCESDEQIAREEANREAKVEEWLSWDEPHPAEIEAMPDTEDDCPF